MLFDEPMVMHSQQPDGRHWLTTLDVPPLQILPVAQNHCRAGHFLARLLAAKLNSQSEIPEEVTLNRHDVAAVASLSRQGFPELPSEAGEVRLRLVALAGPSDSNPGDEDEESPHFITPQPPQDWKSDYDSWIVFVGRTLGVDVPQPSGEDGYEVAMANAGKELQRLLPSLRNRFLSGMDGLNLGFKVGLPTRSGGKEYVWVRPTDWKLETTLVCVLESEPQDCKGYKLGQTLRLPTIELLDYCVGSESKGIVEPGLTNRIAEDYGLVIS